LMVKEFESCIREKRPALTDGEAGLNVLKILEAAQKSVKSKGNQVRICW